MDYLLHCQGCHLADGSGRPGSVPDLRERLGLFPTVPGGRAFLVRVPGSALSSLDDTSLAALLNWMIGRFGPAGAADRYSPYDAAEVARLRGEPLTDVEPLRSALLEAIAARGSDR